jgi:hypothetical protein
MSSARRGRGVPSSVAAVSRTVAAGAAISALGRSGTAHLAQRAVPCRAAPSVLSPGARRRSARSAARLRTSLPVEIAAATPASDTERGGGARRVGSFPTRSGVAAARRTGLPSASGVRSRPTRHAGCQLDNPTWRYLTSRLRFSCICRFPLGFQSHLKGRRTLRSRAQCEGFVSRRLPGAGAQVRRVHAEALTEAHGSARSSIVDAALKQRCGRSVTSDARERRTDAGMMK